MTNQLQQFRDEVYQNFNKYKRTDTLMDLVDALYRDRYYAALCKCGHQRRQHGHVKCFAPGCTCRVWYPPPPTQTEAKEREEQILKELGY